MSLVPFAVVSDAVLPCMISVLFGLCLSCLVVFRSVCLSCGDAILLCMISVLFGLFQQGGVDSLGLRRDGSGRLLADVPAGARRSA